MSTYVRTPLEFKKRRLPVGMIETARVKEQYIAITKSTREAQSLIAQVLMANSKLNPAQKQALQKAKDLLND